MCLILRYKKFEKFKVFCIMWDHMFLWTCLGFFAETKEETNDWCCTLRKKAKEEEKLLFLTLQNKSQIERQEYYLQQMNFFYYFFWLYFFFLVAMIIFLLKKEAGMFHSIKVPALSFFFFFANLLAVSFLTNSNLDQPSDRKELIQEPESHGWKFQIMQESEGLAAILEYTGRETRRNKIYVK